MSTSAPFVLPYSPRLYSDVVQYEDQASFGHCKSVVSAEETAATTYVIGQVLGKVTSTGLYKALLETASDGSQNFAGIYVGAEGDTGEYLPNVSILAANVAQNVVVLQRGPAGVGNEYLIFGTDAISPTQQAAVYAQMLAAGIKLLEQY